MQLAAGFADDDHLAMRGRIDIRKHAISAARHDVAGRSDDQRSERPVALRCGLLRQIQRHTHELFVIDGEQARFRLTWMAIQ